MRGKFTSSSDVSGGDPEQDVQELEKELSLVYRLHIEPNRKDVWNGPRLPITAMIGMT